MEKYWKRLIDVISPDVALQPLGELFVKRLIELGEVDDESAKSLLVLIDSPEPWGDKLPTIKSILRAQVDLDEAIPTSVDDCLSDLDKAEQAMQRELEKMLKDTERRLDTPLAEFCQGILDKVDPGAVYDPSHPFGGLRPVKEPRKAPVFEQRCYICRDPDFAAYGLPLYRACPVCGGHISADDNICWDCGISDQGVYEAAKISKIDGDNPVDLARELLHHLSESLDLKWYWYRDGPPTCTVEQVAEAIEKIKAEHPHA